MADITVIVDRMRAAVAACTFPVGFFQVGESLHFEHGHVSEIANKLTAKNKNLIKYPMVMLVEDFPQEVNAGMIHVEVRLFILAVNPVKTMYAPERYEATVKPFLLPIYEELMEEISKRFSWDKNLYPGNVPPHTFTVRTNFGVWLRELKGTVRNIMNDPTDAIEIESLKINTKFKSC
jgi:hypothetical protein